MSKVKLQKVIGKKVRNASENQDVKIIKDSCNNKINKKMSEA